MSELNVQFGCGFCAPMNWVNFDASLTLRFERLPIIGRLYTKNSTRFPSNVHYGDVVKGLSLPDRAASVVYSSHVLEHLALDECRAALTETYRILKPGGIFRFVIPDFDYCIQKYNEASSPDRLYTFMKSTSLGCEKARTSLKVFFASWLGKSDHKWMWTYDALKVELEKAGFCEVRRATFGDSAFRVFSDVEQEERWTNCLGIECIKK